MTELKDSIESRLASRAALVDKTLMDLQEQRDQDTRQIAILKERVSDLERVTRNTVRFVYVKESKNWNDANEYCKKQYGGQLASILNEKERLKKDIIKIDYHIYFFHLKVGFDIFLIILKMLR